jgi:hypothetical protein
VPLVVPFLLRKHTGLGWWGMMVITGPERHKAVWVVRQETEHKLESHYQQ